MEKLLWGVVRMEKLLWSVVRWKSYSGVYSKNGKDTLECRVRMETLLCKVERMDKLGRIGKLLCSIGRIGKASL